MTKNKKKLLFWASSLSFSLVLLLNITCSKSKPSPESDICKDKTEADILKMPAFKARPGKLTIAYNGEKKVKSFITAIENKTDHVDGLEFLVCFQALDALFIVDIAGFYDTFPPYITKIKGLRTLSLSDVKYKVLPNNIGDLVNLTLISIIPTVGSEAWTTLPDSFYTFKSIKNITLKRTQLPDAVKQKIRTTYPGATIEF